LKNLATLVVLGCVLAWTPVQADSGQSDKDGHLYLGFSLSSLALDNDRLPGIPTSSPGHASKTANLLVGYQFDSYWAADAKLGVDFDNASVTSVALNGYRFFGSGNWRPFISAGLSNFSLDSQALDDSTQQALLGFGMSGKLSSNLELRVGYQRSFTISGDSYQDNEYSAALVWHFGKPSSAAGADSGSAAAAGPMAGAAKGPGAAAAPGAGGVGPGAAGPGAAGLGDKAVIASYKLQVLFDFDKSAIKSAFEPQFEEIAKALKDNPDVTLLVEGHTCWIGTEKYNQGLSERRANAVKQKFVQQYGIPASRITTKGYGESRPTADNKTEQGRRQNRRAIAITLGPNNVKQ